MTEDTEGRRQSYEISASFVPVYSKEVPDFPLFWVQLNLVIWQC
jgi:hypothetical protein